MKASHYMFKECVTEIVSPFPEILRMTVVSTFTVKGTGQLTSSVSLPLATPPLKSLN